jgi:hypothetical protein
MAAVAQEGNSCFPGCILDQCFPEIIIKDVTVIEHHCLVDPIALITISSFGLSAMADAKDGELLPDLAEEVEKPLHHDRWCGMM